MIAVAEAVCWAAAAEATSSCGLWRWIVADDATPTPKPVSGESNRYSDMLGC